MLEINKKIIDYINKCKITCNNDGNIQINGIDADEYEIRVICERLKHRFDFETDKELLVNILSDNNCYTVVDNNDNILDDISKIIEEDDSIPRDDWESYKDWKENKALWNVDKDGCKTSLNKCIDNIVGFIEHFPKTKGKIMFNNVRNQIEWDGRQLTDADIHYVLTLVNKYFIKDISSVRMIKDALDNVAFKHRFNPWVNYFNSLKYEDDGIDYIDYTIKEVLCCEEQDEYYDLYYETLKIGLLASMSRIYNKELYDKAIKYDTVITFCSRNGGTGKTTFPERLFDIEDNGNSYCYVVAGDSFQPNDKDFKERTHQSACLLLDELSMKRAIVTSVKGYITQRDDRFRKSYGYNNEAHKRGFIIMATSNNDDILKDYTTDNERRWAIIKVSEDINNYKNVNKAFDDGFRDKLWSFIKYIYDNKEWKLYMTDERLINLEKKIQRQYKASNNEDYDTIINDLLEREYGFYDDINIDVDSIVAQYKFKNTKEWCEAHNKEYNDKLFKSAEEKYIMKPEDRKIMYWGKIDRIQKTTLYDILRKLGIDYTNKSLAAEMQYTGIWNGWDNKSCRIGDAIVKAYWRKNKVLRTYFESDNNESEIDKDISDTDGLPF